MKKNGFHLIEILITLSIIAILTCIGLPVYTQYLKREHQLAAENTLANLAIAMEHYHFANHTYRAATLNKLHFSDQAIHDFYQLQIVMATEEDYLIAATS